MKTKNLVEVHNFKAKVPNIPPAVVEFYVRTDRGINAGKVIVLSNGKINVEHRDNKWMSKPYIKFSTDRKRNGDVVLNMKGGVDKEAMHIFTVITGNGDFEIKTN